MYNKLVFSNYEQLNVEFKGKVGSGSFFDNCKNLTAIFHEIDSVESKYFVKCEIQHIEIKKINNQRCDIGEIFDWDSKLNLGGQIIIKGLSYDFDTMQKQSKDRFERINYNRKYNEHHITGGVVHDNFESLLKHLVDLYGKGIFINPCIEGIGRLDSMNKYYSYDNESYLVFPYVCTNGGDYKFNVKILNSANWQKDFFIFNKTFPSSCLGSEKINNLDEYIHPRYDYIPQSPSIDKKISGKVDFEGDLDETEVKEIKGILKKIYKLLDIPKDEEHIDIYELPNVPHDKKTAAIRRKIIALCSPDRYGGRSGDFKEFVGEIFKFYNLHCEIKAKEWEPQE